MLNQTEMCVDSYLLMLLQKFPEAVLIKGKFVDEAQRLFAEGGLGGGAVRGGGARGQLRARGGRAAARGRVHRRAGHQRQGLAEREEHGAVPAREGTSLLLPPLLLEHLKNVLKKIDKIFINNFFFLPKLQPRSPTVYRGCFSPLI